MPRIRSVVASFFALLCITQTFAAPTCPAGINPSTQGTWYTKADSNGYFHVYNDALSTSKPQVLRGVSMTGFETGTRMSGSGAGYWMFQAPSSMNMAGSVTVIENVVSTLVNEWNANIIRIPFCGSAWLQNYQVKGYGGVTPMSYRDWIDIAVCKASSMGAAVILDNHLWAIGKQTSATKNVGMEDGCTGINQVGGVDSCAPHDWYGQYTSSRTGQTYNTGDDQGVWQCAIANADGITLENAVRGNNKEHFLNLWHEIALRYKDSSNVFFELFNEPYQRQSAQFASSYGDNILESQYDWKTWSSLMNDAINVIRAAGANNIVVVGGLDWDFDFLGDPTSSNMGPIGNPSLIAWKSQKNIAYSFHPYQHGACCGQIGASTDLSVTDPYQSAFCLFPPTSNNNPLASNSPVPANGKMCDTSGYSETVNKKSPPCMWVPTAHKPGSTSLGLCAGDRDECDGLSQSACNTKNANWQNYKSGGWSKYVLPMNLYGPLIATEFGSFDCSSPYNAAFVKWAAQFGVSYTVWALWAQNSGGPGAGACGYPSVMIPGGDSDGFGMGPKNCLTEASCKQYVVPMPHAGIVVYNDIHARTSYTYTSPTKIDVSQIPVASNIPATGATSAPTTSAPSTPAPSTPAPSTPAPSTSAPSTSAPAPPKSGATSAPTPAPTAIPTPAGGADFIIVQVSPSSSSFWLAVAVQSGSVATTNVELVDYNTYSTWTAFTKTDWGYWSFSAAAELKLPITLRVTSENGQQLVLFHVVTSFSSNIVNTYMTYGNTKATTQPASTPAPSTPAPATQKPATPAPATQKPATPAPATQKPATPAPSTPAPATQKPATPAPSTPAPATQKPTTPAPSTPAPATQKPATPAPSTPAPATQKPATSAPSTSAPSTSTGNTIQVQVHPSTSAHWIGVAVTGGSSPATAVSMKDSGSISSWTALDSTNWGYFIGQPTASIVAPVSLRITSAAGTVDMTNIISTLTNFNPINSGKNYGTPAANPTTSAPTSAPVTSTTPSGPAKPNVKISLYDGSSTWWFAVTVDSDQISTLEIKDSGSISSFKSVQISNWGVWIYQPEGAELKLPITVRATSKAGKQASATFTTLARGQSLDTGVNF